MCTCFHFSLFNYTDYTTVQNCLKDPQSSPHCRCPGHLYRFCPGCGVPETEGSCRFFAFLKGTGFRCSRHNSQLIPDVCPNSNIGVLNKKSVPLNSYESLWIYWVPKKLIPGELSSTSVAIAPLVRPSAWMAHPPSHQHLVGTAQGTLSFQCNSLNFRFERVLSQVTSYKMY